MKKEIIVAIVLGIVFGLVVAGVMVFKTINFGGRSRQVVGNSPSISPVLVNDLNKIKVLEITEPQDLQLFDKKTIKIKGKAGRNDLVVISSQVKDITFRNKNENFSVDFPLALGENTILITVYPKNTQISAQEKSIVVYYLDEQ